MNGLRFSEYKDAGDTPPFDRIFKIFSELIVHTSGDVEEALDWLVELSKTYAVFTDDYGLEEFKQDLIDKGYIKPETKDKPGTGPSITAKTESLLRKHALDQVFGKLKKAGRGNRSTRHVGNSSEFSGDTRPYQFGDAIEHIDMLESIKSAQRDRGMDDFQMDESNLVVREEFHQTQMSTVLMIDISHSMILYGEDRITPAKKVAMALAEMIHTRYPKDSLDLLVFGNDAWQISIRDLPYLQVGPYHTNTVAGLDLAINILRRRKATNKQVFMITDGKPSCIKQKDGYYKNSVGLDEYIVNQCYNKAAAMRRLQIPITTFMIARDPYLQEFVQNFTETNKGRAFYTGLKGLGQLVFEDYAQNRKRKL